MTDSYTPTSPLRTPKDRDQEDWYAEGTRRALLDVLWLLEGGADAEDIRRHVGNLLPGYAMQQAERAKAAETAAAASVPAAPAEDEPVPATLVGDRNEAIKAIRQALRERSGKTWSVTGGTGTAWGWITISAPPGRRVGSANGRMTDEDAAELGELLGLGRPAHHQGESIPASIAYRREYLARAQGRTPEVVGTPYWD